MKKYTFTLSLVPFRPWLWILAFWNKQKREIQSGKCLNLQLLTKLHQTRSKCVFSNSKQHSKLSFWDLGPLKTCFGIKTDIFDQNQDKSQNPYIAKFQKWPKVLCIDPLEGLRGLVSFANFLTPTGASRQVWEATHEASRGPLKGKVSAQKAPQGSRTEMRELLGGTEYESIHDEGSLICHPGKSMHCLFSR